jgi:hypothetical protein
VLHEPRHELQHQRSQGGRNPMKNRGGGCREASNRGIISSRTSLHLLNPHHPTPNPSRKHTHTGGIAPTATAKPQGDTPPFPFVIDERYRHLTCYYNCWEPCNFMGIRSKPKTCIFPFPGYYMTVFPMWKKPQPLGKR